MTVTREHPTARLEERDGVWWQELPDDPTWVFLGWAPAPRNRPQALAHHVLHGLLMGYGVWRTLRWSLPRSRWIA